MKIYTIGIGKKENYDISLLSNIAKNSGGKSFFCQSADELEAVYKSIAKLEPSPIRSEQYLNKNQLAIYPLLLAFLILSFMLFRDEVRA